MSSTIEFRRATLSNGLEILAEVDPSAHSAAAGFFVRTGARDESTDLMGVSHFLEHMMFKGTQDISAAELNRRFDEMGARNNAYTSNELTCFHAHLLPEFVDSGLRLLAQMMRPALRDSDFTMEKGVILEEIAMYKDSPFWVLYEESIARHYGSHPMSHRVLGTTESITTLSRDAMAAYFQNRYSADNTCVALAGKIDFDACVKALESECASWQSTRPQRDTARPKVGGGRFELRDAKVNRGYLIGIASAPAISDERKYAATMLAQVLGAPDNSRLHWALVEDGIAEDCQAAFDGHDGCGEFYVYASGDPEKLPTIERIINEQIVVLADSLEPSDLDRLRDKIATGATIGGEKPEGRMQRLGRHWTALHQYATLDDEVRRITSVTLDDLREVARSFPMQPVTLGTLLPAAPIA
jgi:predicted Zn-dependent peptidase